MLMVDFFDRDAQMVAQALLGKILRAKYGSHWLSAQIVETEAYYLEDKASHASLGFTQKRKALFMPPGTIYMYYARGKDSLNISTRGAGNAVLIKAAKPYLDEKTGDQQLQIMHRLNPHPNPLKKRSDHRLCAGQTLLCKSLHLRLTEWDQKYFQQDRFYIEDRGYVPKQIRQLKRLGIPTGRDEHRLYRFLDNAHQEASTRGKC